MKIYIAHSKGIYYKENLYNPIRHDQELKSYDIILPHEEKDKNNHTRDFYKEIDIMIAEISDKATGLGIELGWAYDDNIPIYCIYEKGKNISYSIYAVTDKIYEYDNKEEMINIIKQIIKKEEEKKKKSQKRKEKSFT